MISNNSFKDNNDNSTIDSSTDSETGSTHSQNHESETSLY
jgi:hypothetical protein